MEQSCHCYLAVPGVPPTRLHVGHTPNSSLSPSTLEWSGLEMWARDHRGRAMWSCDLEDQDYGGTCWKVLAPQEVSPRFDPSCHRPGPGKVVWIAQWGLRTPAQAGHTIRLSELSSGCLTSGGGGRKAGRGHVKRGTRQGKERRRRRGPQVTRPQQGRKGLSTPSAQTWLVVVKAAGQIQET